MSNPRTPSTPQPPRPSQRNIGTVLIVVGVVVAVVIGFVAIGLLVGHSSSASSATTPSKPTKAPVSTPPTAPATAPTSVGPTNLPPLNCTKPPALPTKPQQFAKPPSPSLSQNATWQATLTTNCGTIVIDLNGKVAPQTVASFIFLSQKKFYDDSPCHRLVVTGIYVLQCGDPTGSGSGGPGYTYGIENAPASGDYPTGSVAMARTNDPNSNGSQFFIVFADTQLPAPGYSIFGKVVKGLPIVQAIAEKGVAADGVAPAQPISIIKSSVVKL